MPLRPGPARFLVLGAVFVCAACGLVYELALVALGSFLIGDSVVQASLVLSIMVFAMGVGSLLAKPLQHRAVLGFAVVEGLLALIGGTSVLVLYACFAWLGLYQPVLVVVAFTIGVLIGAEIPLLMTLIQRIRQQDAGSAVADLFAADYVGALLGGLAFPFLLLPALGQVRGALAVGAVNAAAGIAVVLWLFRAELGRRDRVLMRAGMVAVLLVLAVTFVMTGRFEDIARRALFGGPVAYADRSAYHEIVLTGGGGADLRLYLDGDLRASADGRGRQEALVRPALAGRTGATRVLVIGGGEGLALREVLRHPGLTEAVVVEPDPALVRLARHHPSLTALNGRALTDPRVRVVEADPFTWLRGQVGGGTTARPFDAIIVDLPVPDRASVAKLYSVEFYGMARRLLAADGRMTVPAGPLHRGPTELLWCVDATLRAAGLTTAPYRAGAPDSARGFVLAGRRLPDSPRGTVPGAAGDPAVPDGGPADPSGALLPVEDPASRPLRAQPSTLLDPRVVDSARAARARRP